MKNGYMMHRWIILLLPLICLCAMASAGCGSARVVEQRTKDAVRIKADREAGYRRAPGTGSPRDGRTLRGTAIEIQILPRPSAPDKIDTTLIFLDATLENKRENYERIPIDDVDRIADLMTLPADTSYGNMNVVESFNTTEQIPELRRLPVLDYPRLQGGGSGNNQDCGCLPLDFSFPFPELECPQRFYGWYFAELRGVYGAFNDRPTRAAEQGREGYQGEIAAGLRFGSMDEWGIGLAYSTGINVYDSYGGSQVLRPMALLHLRYQTPGPVTNILGICMKPFVYAQGGATIDRATINLMKFNLSSTEECGECGEMVRDLEASGQLGDVDLSMPVTFGLGIGVDIPVFSFMDISTDIGWRSIGLGENADLGGWRVPSLRRVNTFFLRAGVTF